MWMQENNDNEITLLVQEIGQRLFERLDFIKIKSQTLLNLGETSSIQSLKTKYPTANILNTEPTELFITSEALQIPIKNNSVDCIFSNGLLEWSTHLPLLLPEIKRILKPDGCVLFSTFGPDTLKELNTNFSLTDMHDMGDALVQYSFLDPVMDAEMIQLRYSDTFDLWNTLQTTPFKTLLKKDQDFQHLSEKHLTFELIYGLAFNTTDLKLPVKIL